MPTFSPTRTYSMERDRIPELDLLRFIAAVSVVLFHATNWPSDPNLLTRVATYGSLGVPLFFMISGFVILMTAQNRSGIEFINSRIARLYPSFWIAVLLSVLALTLLADDPPSLATIVANLTMQPHAFDQPYIDMVYWTLVVEMKFYALTWLVIVTRQMKRVETLLMLWLAVTAGRSVGKDPGLARFDSDADVRLAVRRRLLPVPDPFARRERASADCVCRQCRAVDVLDAAVPAQVHALDIV